MQSTCCVLLAASALGCVTHLLMHLQVLIPKIGVPPRESAHTTPHERLPRSFQAEWDTYFLVAAFRNVFSRSSAYRKGPEGMPSTPAAA